MTLRSGSTSDFITAENASRGMVAQGFSPVFLRLAGSPMRQPRWGALAGRTKVLRHHRDGYETASTIFAVLVAVAGFTTSSRAQTPSSTASSTPAWRQVAYIKASNPGELDEFGFSVALSDDGSTLAVGARMEGSGATGINGNQADESAYSSGAVYVFTRSGKPGSNSWSQQAYLKASNTGRGDQFGYAVALSADGNTLAVSAYFEDSGSNGINGNQADNSVPQSGAVYVFTRKGTSWSQQAYIKASNPGEVDDGDTFGFSIALSDDGNTLAVGAPSEDSNASGINGNQADNSAIGAGAVYVFVRSGTTWSQQAYVKSDTPAQFTNGDLFGYSVGLSADGNTLAVGDYDESGSSTVINGPIDNGTGGSGAVYVFTRRGGTWAREAYLKGSAQDRADSLGSWVAISDDGSTVAGGALDEDSLTTGINAVESGHTGRVGTPDDRSSGAAYVFFRDGPPSPKASAASAKASASPDVARESAVGPTWTQQASFKASNTGVEDTFGVRLALSGDGNTFASGAPHEDSAAQGINGKQDDNSALDAGAVYVFDRKGTSWTQGAYVKGSNTEAFDEIGSAVAFNRDGRMMAIGARFEDSGAKGVNGNQADNSVSDSGAVYIFAR